MKVPRIIPLIEDAPSLLCTAELTIENTMHAWKERFGHHRQVQGISGKIGFAHLSHVQTLSCKYAINGLSELNSKSTPKSGLSSELGLASRHLDLKTQTPGVPGIGPLLQSALRYSHKKATLKPW